MCNTKKPLINNNTLKTNNDLKIYDQRRHFILHNLLYINNYARLGGLYVLKRLVSQKFKTVRKTRSRSSITTVSCLRSAVQ